MTTPTTPVYLPDPANDETLTMTGYDWWRYRAAIERETVAPWREALELALNEFAPHSGLCCPQDFDGAPLPVTAESCRCRGTKRALRQILASAVPPEAVSLAMLDEAWRAAEAAVPEGWRPITLGPPDPDWEPLNEYAWAAWTASQEYFEGETSADDHQAEGAGPTPTEALQALTRALLDKEPQP